MKTAVFIIAPENFRDEELFEPLAVLSKNGIETKIGSAQSGLCYGKLGGEIEAELGLDGINVQDFDAIIFVGGGGSQIFLDEPKALELARDFFEQGKITAAICAGPTILAKAGILKGKKATVFPDSSYENILLENGADLTKSELEIDGNLITANGPKVATRFGEMILEKLGK